MTLPSAEQATAYGNLSAAEVASLDEAAIDIGVSLGQLLEHAGWQVARHAWAMLGRRAGRVGVIAGRGNNGGDGAVAARLLTAWGCSVHLHLLTTEAKLGGGLAWNADGVQADGARLTVMESMDLVQAALQGCDLAIDALLGSGLQGPPRALQAEAIAELSRYRTLAVDVPSGLDATEGVLHSATVQAAATCTLSAMKRGLWPATSRSRAGEIMAADVGIPLAAWTRCGLTPPKAVMGGELTPVPS